MDINEHERLSNITLRYKLKQSKNIYGYKWTWETSNIILRKEQLIVRKDMDVNQSINQSIN
jgi:hypothetical protein